MTDTIEKFKQQLSDIQSLLQFPVMLRKLWSGSEIQEWLNSTLIERIKEFIEFHKKEIKSKDLFLEAYKEAVAYTLDGFGSYEAEDAIQFLQYWNEGDWPAIKKYYPEFDLDSEAHIHLIQASGGMPT